MLKLAQTDQQTNRQTDRAKTILTHYLLTPARAPNRWRRRDKHPHPPTRCARQQISQEPTMEPSKALPRVTIVLSHPTAKHPDHVSSWDRPLPGRLNFEIREVEIVQKNQGFPISVSIFPVLKEHSVPTFTSNRHKHHMG
ncbi:hypothetical protein DPMN_118840 [Dreissena polymorpha]|uniref:Uncharacterized protein n=1 Tax=Dreissena polymorpha TaxID=45954 RepID=A0A9D4GNU5_DREPO|nr:hypothetical protein DPMN_118840 [Dreissena polymorpha]